MAALIRFDSHPNGGFRDVFVNPAFVTAVGPYDEVACSIWVMGSTYPLNVAGNVFDVGTRIQRALTES